MPTPATENRSASYPIIHCAYIEGRVSGCLTPNRKTDTCVLMRRNVNTPPRTHVLKMKEMIHVSDVHRNPIDVFKPQQKQHKKSTYNMYWTNGISLQKCLMHMYRRMNLLRNQPEWNKKLITVYHRTARTHRAEQNVRHEQLGPHQIIAVCYVYVSVPSLIWICRRLSPNHNLEIFVACGWRCVRKCWVFLSCMRAAKSVWDYVQPCLKHQAAQLRESFHFVGPYI